jgi:hypothetical protein
MPSALLHSTTQDNAGLAEPLRTPIDKIARHAYR